MIESNPDLQELDRAGDGSVSRLLGQFLTAPLPQRTSSVLEQSVGHPLLEQALLAASELVKVEGLPADTSGRMLSDALQAAYRDGEPNLLGLLRHVPGESLSIDFQALAFYAKRLRANQDDARTLVRQFLGQVDKPDVDAIEGLSPAISIDQKSTSHNPLQALSSERRRLRTTFLSDFDAIEDLDPPLNVWRNRARPHQEF